MKRSILTSMIGLAVVAVSLSDPTAVSAQPLSKTQVISIIKAKVPSALDEALRDLRGIKVGPPTCQSEFDQAVRAAEQEFSGCLNVDNPPPGSPLANFNSLSNIGVQQFCGGLTGDQCAAKVLEDQQRFCAREKAKDIAKAKSIKARCEAEARECAVANAKVQITKKQITEAEQQIAQLQQKLANLRASLPGLEANAQAECR